jgi:hypothetical protein
MCRDHSRSPQFRLGVYTHLRAQYYLSAASVSLALPIYETWLKDDRDRMDAHRASLHRRTDKTAERTQKTSF